MNQEGRAEDIDYNVAVLVHRSPQILPLPLDVQEQFVQMPCVAQRATSAVLTHPGLCRSAPARSDSRSSLRRHESRSFLSRPTQREAGLVVPGRDRWIEVQFQGRC